MKPAHHSRAIVNHLTWQSNRHNGTCGATRANDKLNTDRDSCRTNTQSKEENSHMSRSKKRNADDENRAFNQERTPTCSFFAQKQSVSCVPRRWRLLKVEMWNATPSTILKQTHPSQLWIKGSESKGPFCTINIIQTKHRPPVWGEPPILFSPDEILADKNGAPFSHWTKERVEEWDRRKTETVQSLKSELEFKKKTRINI